MRIAITGGTGFVGRHLARALVGEGHEVILLARGVDDRDGSIRDLPRARFIAIDLCDEEAMAAALAGCNAVAHCAGINRELGAQSYARVHVESTRVLVHAARRAGVRKIALVSFLRARPDCGSAYHESKWAAEEILRGSGADFTILKCGMIYGHGDHMLDHLGRMLHMAPLLFAVGFRAMPIRPVAVEDVVRILRAALVDRRLTRQTVAVVGPEQMTLVDAVRRVGETLGKRVRVIRLPVWMHYISAYAFEKLMRIPPASRAQIRMLTEGIAEPVQTWDPLPADLRPAIQFHAQQIRKGLPESGGFGLSDLRWCHRKPAVERS